MSNDQQRAEKLECGRDIPAVTKEKEIAPEAPSCDLGRDQQCVACIAVECVMQPGGKRNLKSHFFHLVHAVSVAGFDDPALRLFAKAVAASLFERRWIGQALARCQIAGEAAFILPSTTERSIHDSTSPTEPALSISRTGDR